MSRRVNITDTLSDAWPDTDVSYCNRSLQSEFCQKWMRQFVTWLYSTNPQPDVIEGALAEELRYREDQRHQDKQEKRRQKRSYDKQHKKGKRW